MEGALLILPTGCAKAYLGWIPRLSRSIACQSSRHGNWEEFDYGTVRLGGHAAGKFENLQKRRNSAKVLAFATSSFQSSDERNGAEMAILAEVEGVLADVHRHGHRQSFNVAFQDMGLDCANWAQPVYADLLRRAGGNEERMLTLFFDQIGWPSSLPTKEKDAFVRKLIQKKQQALENLAKSESLQLRPGIENFVDETIEAGIPIVFLTAYSRIGEHIARFLVERLGSKRLQFVKVLGKEEVESSMYGQFMLGAGTFGQEEELAKEFSQAVVAEKQRVAEEVASILKLSVGIDTSFSQGSKEAIMLLRAGAEACKVAVHRCVLLAGGDPGVQAALRVGMPCIVVRSSVTSRAEFPGARAAFDGYGAGEVTLARLRKYI